jgi:hypothetical protein
MDRNAADAAGSARPKGEHFPASSATKRDYAHRTICTALDQPGDWTMRIFTQPFDAEEFS